MEYFTILMRILFLFSFLLIICKLIGKKKVMYLDTLSFSILIIICFIISISILVTNISILRTIYCIILLCLCLFTFYFILFKNKDIRDIFKEKDTIIIKNGKLNIRGIIACNSSFYELFNNLIEINISDISKVKCAIINKDGKLLIYKDDTLDDTNFIPVITRGKVLYDKLKLLNKDEDFLKKSVGENFEDIFFAFYNKGSIYVIKND